jgi:hypothetical protein
MQKCTYILSFDNKYNSDNGRQQLLTLSINYSVRERTMLSTIYNEIPVLHARHLKIKANMY